MARRRLLPGQRRPDHASRSRADARGPEVLRGARRGQERSAQDPREVPMRPPGMVARLLDSVVAAVSPERALRRSHARARLSASASPELRNAQRDRHVAALRFEAAKIDRLRTKMSSGSADGDLLPDLDTLRQKSEALVRDDPHAAAAIRVLLENVVGSGITPQAAVRPEQTGCTESQCAEFNRAAEQ